MYKEIRREDLFDIIINISKVIDKDFYENERKLDFKVKFNKIMFDYP